MRVAVVGHGPGPAGCGLGSVVDGCDLVIRMMGSDWQDPVDYGCRFDVSVLLGRRIERDLRACRVVGVEPAGRWPGEFWVFCPNGDLASAYRRQGLLGGVPREVFDLSDEVGGWPDGIWPTRGLAACMMAVRRYPGVELVLFGCDALAGGRVGYHPEYGRIMGFEDAGCFDNGCHDWDLERAWLAGAVDRGDCRIEVGDAVQG